MFDAYVSRGTMGIMDAVRYEHACGCIPFRRSRAREIEVLMILRTKGYWEFPKGRKVGDESDETTALRELREETGLMGELVPAPPFMVRYVFTRGNERFHKEVRYFLCRVPDGSRVHEEHREVNDHVWLTLERLADRATYPEMKEVARRAAELLAD